ncbi:MAG: S8 family serine peptidase [Legionella sp.]|uniref:S8 family serine peptidase n=1 Tax=Legionella sp. TaxID=459 RepID=UPI0039E6CA65
MHFKSVVFGLGLLSLAHNALALPNQNTVRVIIKYKHQVKNTVALKLQIAQLAQLPVKELNPMANGAYSLILIAPQTSLAQKQTEDPTTLVLEHLRQNPEVLYAVRDRVGHFTPVSDPVLSYVVVDLLTHESQWDEFTRPSGIMLESKAGSRDGAWAYTTGWAKKPVVVAVLDTGISLNDSIVNNLVKGSEGAIWGWNFSANNNNLADETRSFHGTHVAGIIAGYGNVMKGVGEDLKILPIKITNSSGMFYESSVINAIYWAVGGDVSGIPNNIYPAKVLNMSFGVDRGPKDEIDYCDQALQEAIFFARKKGAVLAVAAGNDNLWEHYNAPAVCNGTIKVGATGPEGLRSYFSNYGPSITLAAPGGDKRYGLWGGILSTVNPGGGYNGSGFDYYQGTSMATPHVAGVAGLIFSASDKNLTPEQIEQILYTTTHEFGESNDPNKSCVGKKPCGHGILDAENAVKAALAYYDVLFSAPKVEYLGTKICGIQGLRPGKKRVDIHGVVWMLEHADCQAKLKYQAPHTLQTKDGAILVSYGVVNYRLDQSAYKSCHVIGYDGVGCYF